MQIVKIKWSISKWWLFKLGVNFIAEYIQAINPKLNLKLTYQQLQNNNFKMTAFFISADFLLMFLFFSWMLKLC